MSIENKFGYTGELYTYLNKLVDDSGLRIRVSFDINLGNEIEILKRTVGGLTYFECTLKATSYYQDVSRYILCVIACQHVLKHHPSDVKIHAPTPLDYMDTFDGFGKSTGAKIYNKYVKYSRDLPENSKY